MRGYFAQVRRAGFDIGLSTEKLTRAMVDLLLQLPPEAALSKELVVQHLGLLGQMSKTRDINDAWNIAKRQVVRAHPDRFCIDGKALRPASAMENRPREKLSAAGQRRLATLAAKEGMTPDELLTHKAFAVNDAYFCRELGLSPERVNNFGSSPVYGHPQAPTGLRSIIELIEELHIAGGGHGLFTGCAAGDTAMAVVLKVS